MRISFTLMVVALGLWAREARAQDDSPPAPATPPAPGAAVPPAGAPAPYVAPPEAPAAERPRTANNAVFAELLGNGGIYSINYERFLGDFGVRAGFSYLSLEGSTTLKCGSTGPCSTASAKVSLTTVPIVGSYYLGGENHKLQLGAGLTVMAFSGDSSTDFGTSGSRGTFVVGTAVVG
ncbi:MAG TPA: hypothetical protein VFS00_08345, partial [Polyangiaceae bacterium]|nr:hypothetical protein [Polyangiaceae bacterium]